MVFTPWPIFKKGDLRESLRASIQFNLICKAAENHNSQHLDGLYNLKEQMKQNQQEMSHVGTNKKKKKQNEEIIMYHKIYVKKRAEPYDLYAKMVVMMERRSGEGSKDNNKNIMKLMGTTSTNKKKKRR